MRVKLGKVYDQTVTVINKLDAKDSSQKQDEYFKHVFNHCMWSLVTTRDVDINGVVTIGTSHRVQIAENVDYLPYKEWVNADHEKVFTVRAGDYVVLGEVTEEITASTIRKVIPLYEPDAFQVQSFRDATKGEGFDHSTSGILRFIEPYVIEG